MKLRRLTRGKLVRGDNVVDAPTLDEERLADLAALMYASRRDRATYINFSLFGEPVWDMLLALYCFPPRGEQLSVSGLCYAAEVPPTTALRWAVLLEQKNLVIRERDLRDGRRVFVKLSPEGHNAMTKYLSTVYDKVASTLIFSDPETPLRSRLGVNELR